MGTSDEAEVEMNFDEFLCRIGAIEIRYGHL